MNKKVEIEEQGNVISVLKKIDEILEKSNQLKDKDVKLSIELAIEAKLLSEEHFYTKGLANSLIHLGKSYQNISNYGEAMKCALQAIELFKGLNDTFGESGKPAELYEKYGLTSEDVAKAAKKAISRKAEKAK